MTLKKFFMLLMFIIMLMIILAFLLDYAETNNNKTNINYIDTVEYKQKINDINKLKNTIDSLINKNEYDKDKINNLDDSSTIKLFIELAEGE